MMHVTDPIDIMMIRNIFFLKERDYSARDAPNLVFSIDNDVLLCIRSLYSIYYMTKIKANF